MMDQSAKRKAVFDFDELCFVCQKHKKDPKTGNRMIIPPTPIHNEQLVRDQYDRWKKKTAYPDSMIPTLNVLDKAFSQFQSLS